MGGEPEKLLEDSWLGGCHTSADPALSNEVERHRRLLKQWRRETQDEIGKRSPVQKVRKGKNK